MVREPRFRPRTGRTRRGRIDNPLTIRHTIAGLAAEIRPMIDLRKRVREMNAERGPIATLRALAPGTLAVSLLVTVALPGVVRGFDGIGSTDFVSAAVVAAAMLLFLYPVLEDHADTIRRAKAGQAPDIRTGQPDSPADTSHRDPPPP